MVSTTVLVTVVLAAFATMATAIYALAARIGTQVDKQSDRIDAQGASLGDRIDAQGVRIDAQGASLGERIDAQGLRIDRLSDEVAGLRAAVAGIDARVATLEQR